MWLALVALLSKSGFYHAGIDGVVQGKTSLAYLYCGGGLTLISFYDYGKTQKVSR